MKIVYCVLELGEKKAPNAEEIARLTGAKAKDVAIKELRACTAGAEKVFAKLTDVYLWTNKYHYGLWQDKLTFISIKGLSELSVLFMARYSEELRLAIAASSIGIFDPERLTTLNQASLVSLDHYLSERIDLLRPYVAELEDQYKLLYLYNNPYNQK